MRLTTTQIRARRRKQKSIPWWLRLWPLLLSIAATPIALRAASVLALTGPSALRILYPYVVLVQLHAQRFTPYQEETLSQWIMYGQFPAYGLLWILAARVLGGSAGPLSVVLLHCGGVAAAILSSSG